jgi:hypothetical protein
LCQQSFNSEIQESVNHIISETTEENQHYATIFQYVNTPKDILPTTIINPVFIGVSIIPTIKRWFPTMESALILVNQNKGEEMYRHYKESHRK